jgi:hypothetical protein
VGEADILRNPFLGDISICGIVVKPVIDGEGSSDLSGSSIVLSNLRILLDSLLSRFDVEILLMVKGRRNDGCDIRKGGNWLVGGGPSGLLMLSNINQL